MRPAVGTPFEMEEPEAPEARQTGKDGLPSDHDERSGNGGVADDDGFQEGNR